MNRFLRHMLYIFITLLVLVLIDTWQAKTFTRSPFIKTREYYVGNTRREYVDHGILIKYSKYRNGEEGTIAVVGPKRMEYAKVVGILKYINDKIEKGDES